MRRVSAEGGAIIEVSSFFTDFTESTISPASTAS
jgi:hypothetical protein